MRTFRTLVAVLLMPVLPVLAGSTVSTPETSLELYRDLPRDPLAVFGIYVDDPTFELDGLIKLIDRFAIPAGADALDIDRRLETMLPPELLRNIGPEITLAIDLSPIDEAIEALQTPDEDTLGHLLGKTGVVAGARDEGRLDQALRVLGGRLGAEVVDEAGLVRIRLPLRGATPSKGLSLYYAVRDGRLVLGFSPEWVRGVFEAPAKGQRLIDGHDFTTVFANLDAHPTDLTYVNLPKLHEYVTRSEVVS